MIPIFQDLTIKVVVAEVLWVLALEAEDADKRER
jgi:hypothetical protein